MEAPDERVDEHPNPRVSEASWLVPAAYRRSAGASPACACPRTGCRTRGRRNARDSPNPDHDLAPRRHRLRGGPLWHHALGARRPRRAVGADRSRWPCARRSIGRRRSSARPVPPSTPWPANSLPTKWSTADDSMRSFCRRASRRRRPRPSARLPSRPARRRVPRQLPPRPKGRVRVGLRRPDTAPVLPTDAVRRCATGIVPPSRNNEGRFEGLLRPA